MPTAPAEGTREQKKQLIVDEAFKLIDEIGPREFSMRKLARKLDMSPMGAYGYFDSKDELLLACYKKLYDSVDNRPVPGETWDETLHRICGSLHDVMNSHFKVREIRDLLPEQVLPTTHRKHIYLLHRDQGMPESVFRGIYVALSLFMGTFFRREDLQRANKQLEPEAVQQPQEPWITATAISYDEETFHEGITWMVNSVRSYRAPDPCDWRTPEDPSEWTWEE